jgi:glucose-like phosphotransferase system IIB component
MHFSEKTKEPTNLKNMSLTDTIIKGLGGEANIAVLTNCVSRLRVTVIDEKLVDENILNLTGNFGIKKMQNKYQIIYGPRVVNIATELKEHLHLEE